MGESSCRSSSRAAHSLADFPELEHDLGLFAGDGALKPSGRALAEQIERRGELEGGTLVSHRALVVDDSDPATFREPLGPGGELFEAWVRAAVADGVGPQIVLASRSHDAAQLQTRGITELLEPDPTGVDQRVHVRHPAFVTP